MLEQTHSHLKRDVVMHLFDVPPFLRSPARFYQLLADYGKGSVDKLDQREKQLIEMQKRQQAELMRCGQQVLKFISNNRLQLVAVNAFNLQDKP